MTRVLLLTLIAVVSNALWLGEVCLVKGWAGLRWLDGFNWSSIPISVLVAVACVVVLPKLRRNARPSLFVVLMSALTLATFALTRYILMSLMGRTYFVTGELSSHAATAVLLLILCGLALSFGVVLLAARFLAPLAGWTVICVALAVLLALPLAVGSIAIVPAINGATDAIHAVKMGYPVFWAVFLVPLALRAGVSKDLADSER
jgi:hypothetical protein